jgi:hypothetical protein
MTLHGLPITAMLVSDAACHVCTHGSRYNTSQSFSALKLSMARVLYFDYCVFHEDNPDEAADWLT